MFTMTSNRKSLVSLASAAILMLLAAGAQATTRNVPSQYSTIQSAINASFGGDTIIVAAGFYQEVLTWDSKNLTIRGAGPGRSIIDARSTSTGESRGRCLYIKNLSSLSRIEGFTFQGGKVYNDSGGGIYCDNSYLTINNCEVYNNQADYGGGGLYINGNKPTITYCTFRLNKSGGGGGIYNHFGLPTTTITNCIFTGNSAIGGGGMYNEQSNPRMANCVFDRNSAAVFGGGMYNKSSNPTIFNSTFSANGANYSNGGGGMYNENSAPTAKNCIFWDNHTQGNLSPGDTGISGSAYVTFSDVQGLPNTVPDQYGNFAADPLFTDAQNGDVHLLPGSPCRDRGYNVALSSPPFLKVTGDVFVDMDTCRRVSSGIVDLGAYEFQSLTDVSAQIQITKGSPSYPGITGSFTQVLTLKNTGGTYLNGPISLVINGLTGYTLSNRTGVTSALSPTGRPYINLPGGLAPGASVSITLKFTRTISTATFSYTTQVYDGYGTR